MKKIPTLFLRDPKDMRHVTSQVHPLCTWVLDGEGVATRKYDGTCVMFDGDEWWTRREIKTGGARLPLDFVAVHADSETGKVVGWEPASNSGFYKYLCEAVAWLVDHAGTQPTGTYELCGPKINGNPEGFPDHTLVMHDFATRFDLAPRDYAGLKEWLLGCGMEGIVWHHPDGRMAKIKRRDFW